MWGHLLELGLFTTERLCCWLATFNPAAFNKVHPALEASCRGNGLELSTTNLKRGIGKDLMLLVSSVDDASENVTDNGRAAHALVMVMTASTHNRHNNRIIQKKRPRIIRQYRIL